MVYAHQLTIQQQERELARATTRIAELEALVAATTRDGGHNMGYYVTVRDAGKTGFLLGPYPTHDEALGNVEHGRELALKRDPFAHFYAFGTARATERQTVFGVGEAKASR